jgi:hypothetical protein
MLLGNKNILSNGSARGIAVDNIGVRDSDAISKVRKHKNMRLLYRLTFVKNNVETNIEVGPNVEIAGQIENITACELHEQKQDFTTQSGHEFKKSEYAAGYATKLEFDDDFTFLVNDIPVCAHKKERLFKCF